MSSRVDGSDVFHVAEEGVPCPAYGGKAGVAGVMGDSAGYLQSLGFDELGLASADIQFVMPVCPYSKVRVVDALEGTARVLVTGCCCPSGPSWDLLLGSGEKGSLPAGFKGGAML